MGGEFIRVCNSAWVDGSKVKPDPPLEKGPGSASHRKGWQGADRGLVWADAKQFNTA